MSTTTQDTTSNRKLDGTIFLPNHIRTALTTAQTIIDGQLKPRDILITPTSVKFNVLYTRGNWNYETQKNVPIESLRRVIDNLLKEGATIHKLQLLSAVEYSVTLEEIE